MKIGGKGGKTGERGTAEKERSGILRVGEKNSTQDNGEKSGKVKIRKENV